MGDSMSLNYREVIDLINDRTSQILSEVRDIREVQIKEIRDGLVLQKNEVASTKTNIDVINNNLKWMKSIVVLLIIPVLLQIVNFIIHI